MNRGTSRNREYSKLMEKHRGIASGEGLILNPDTDRLEKSAGLMTEMIALAGAGFCPCKQSHSLDRDTGTACPCPEWPQEIETPGHCSCRLFCRRDPS